MIKLKLRIAAFLAILLATSVAHGQVIINTDKAAYKLDEVVTFSLNKTLPAGTQVKYYHLGHLLQTESVTRTSWKWMPPKVDFKGYLAEIINGKKIYATIAIDVSSNPARFPRNGFLSAYGKLSKAYMDSVMRAMNRYHMNYVQFQDWEYEHHKPLAGTVAHPLDHWKDIGSRDNYKYTVQNYIKLAHHYNMFTLHYNLIYGSLDNANEEGVSDTWRFYEDDQHKSKERIGLPAPPFKSGLNIMNPANKNWQQYLAKNTADAWKVYAFDGYQIDQMGNLNKPLYTYDGKRVLMDTTFGQFIKAMKNYFPHKSMVMNAVSQYGQQSIASAPVDFLYTEVWPPDNGFKDLVNVILHNDSLTKGRLRTVVPAYMDYDIAEQPGWFNTTGIIMADAVIFAFGGAHLELGDHMLGKEYFPNAKLQMHDDLKEAMVRYYDFLTAYENLLRDGGKFNQPEISTTDNGIILNNWPPVIGQVSVIGKQMGSRQIIHLLNFNNANSLNWRDNKGTQNAPRAISSLRLVANSVKKIKSIWLASPDINGGAPQNLNFTQNGITISFTLPSLNYWDMVVFEY